MKYLRATIRLTAFMTLSVVIYFTWWVTSFFIPNKQYWRQLAFDIWSRRFAGLAGMQIEVIGDPPHPPFFLVANHLSYVDIPLLRAVVRGVFVAKHDLVSWFFAGKVIGDMGTVFIDRGNRRDIPRAGAEIIQKLSDGEGVIVFPEGTSSKGEEVLPFNSSFFEFAARSDVPVSYASISYRTPEGWPPASEAVCWWDDTPFLTHMFRLFMVPYFTAIINFGSETVLNTDRKELSQVLHDKIESSFVPVL